MISFKDFSKLNEARKGNPYNYEKDSGAKGLAHKVGDSVWAKHPTEKSKTIAGKVTKIGRTLTTLQHKDGTEATYPHADVSADFSKLNPNPYRKNESVELDESATRFIQKVTQAANAAASGKHINAKMHLDNARTFMLGVKSTDMSKIHDAHETYKNLRKKYSGSGGNFTPSHNQVGNAKVSESEELDESANIPLDKVHKHVQEFMGARHQYQTRNAHENWHSYSHFVGKVNSGLKAIGVKPQHIATLAAKIRPAQYEQEELDEAEGLTTKKNKNGGHDVYHNGTHIGHVEQKSMPWLRGKTIKKVFAKKPNGDSVVVDSDDMGKNTIESAKKTLLKHHLAESVELDEATFVSDSPATYGSRGTKFDVRKNKEKSTGEHDNGQPKEHHDVYHDGKHVGHVASYSGYKDKKAPGARIVTSRKNVRLWQATVHGGEHNRHGSVFNTTPAGSQYTGTGFASKKDALQHFADAHNSNKSR